MAKSTVSRMLSSVSPGRPKMKKPHVSRPMSFAIRIALRTWSLVMPFFTSFSTRSLPLSIPKPTLHRPTSFSAVRISSLTMSARSPLATSRCSLYGSCFSRAQNSRTNFRLAVMTSSRK